MIKLLFGRFSTAVMIAEAIGIILLAASTLRCILTGNSPWDWGFVGAIALLYAFIRFCTTVRWYRGVPRNGGIELQFRKALVPTGYTMSITLVLYIVTGWIVWLVICTAFLIVIAHVNVILLYFHFRDRDVTPVNFYTSGNFLTKADPRS